MGIESLPVPLVLVFLERIDIFWVFRKIGTSIFCEKLKIKINNKCFLIIFISFPSSVARIYFALYSYNNLENYFCSSLFIMNGFVENYLLI